MWLLWHWSWRSQLALCKPGGRVGSKFNWPSEDQCQRSHSKWVFVFIACLECKYSHLILSKLSRKSPICPQRSPWLHIVLVRSLRTAWLDIASLVKSVTYFDPIGYIGGYVHEFRRSKYKFSSHPKTLELTGKCGVMTCKPWTDNLLPDNTRPLTEPISTYHQRAPVALTVALCEIRYSKCHGLIFLQYMIFQIIALSPSVQSVYSLWPSYAICRHICRHWLR